MTTTDLQWIETFRSNLRREKWYNKYSFLTKMNSSKIKVSNDDNYKKLVNSVFVTTISILSDFCSDLLCIVEMSCMKLYAYSMFRKFIEEVNEKVKNYFTIEIANGTVGCQLFVKVHVLTQNKDRYYEWDNYEFKQIKEKQFNEITNHYSNDNTSESLNLIPLIFSHQAEINKNETNS